MNGKATEPGSTMATGSPRRSLTVAGALYLAVLAFAAILRLGQLDQLPLSPAEAEEALTVWQYWQPGPPEAVPGSPAYHTLTLPLTQLLGYGEHVMRLIPALFGLGLVGLPWLLRRRLGALGALVAALLMALSTSQVLTGRLVGGQVISLFASALLFVAWLRYRDSGENRWLYVLTAAAALGLAGSAELYSAILALLGAWLIQRLLGPQLAWDTPLHQLSKAETWKRPLLFGAAIFLALNTGFLLNPGLVGAAAKLPVEWLAQFGLPEPQKWFNLLQALLRYELIIVALVAPAAVWAARQDRPFPLFLAYWLLAAALLSFLHRGDATGLSLWTVPAYLLIGHWVGAMYSQATAEYKWPALALVLVAGAVFYANLVRYARLSSFAGLTDTTYHLVLLVATLLVTLSILFVLTGWHGPGTGQGALTGLLLILLLQSWGTAWWMSRAGTADTREPWTEAATDDEIRLLADTVADLSWQTTNSRTGLEIVTTLVSPSLGWYLREAGNLVQASAIPPGQDSMALITPQGSAPELESNYIGTDLGYTLSDAPVVFEDLSQYLRWWLFHEVPLVDNQNRLIFWIRADLVGEA